MRRTTSSRREAALRPAGGRRRAGTRRRGPMAVEGPSSPDGPYASGMLCPARPARLACSRVARRSAGEEKHSTGPVLKRQLDGLPVPSWRIRLVARRGRPVACGVLALAAGRSVWSPRSACPPQCRREESARARGAPPPSAPARARAIRGARRTRPASRRRRRWALGADAAAVDPAEARPLKTPFRHVRAGGGPGLGAAGRPRLSRF